MGKGTPAYDINGSLMMINHNECSVNVGGIPYGHANTLNAEQEPNGVGSSTDKFQMKDAFMSVGATHGLQIPGLTTSNLY